MVFDWDDAKRRANLAKHGVDFAAIGEFDWDSAVIRQDARQDYGESRFLATGQLGRRLHVLIFTRRSEVIRIISLRRANPRERKLHEQSAKAPQA